MDSQHGLIPGICIEDTQERATPEWIAACFQVAFPSIEIVATEPETETSDRQFEADQYTSTVPLVSPDRETLHPPDRTMKRLERASLATPPSRARAARDARAADGEVPGVVAGESEQGKLTTGEPKIFLQRRRTR